MTHGVASCFQTREHNRAYTGKSRAGGTANGAEYGAGNYSNDAESALNVADKNVNHIDHFLSYLTAFHNAASQNKHGDSNQRYRVHLGEAVWKQLRGLIARSIYAAEENQPGAGSHETDGNGNTYY